MRWLQFDHLLDGRRPIGYRLTRAAVNEVKVERIEACRAGKRYPESDVVGVVLTSKRGEHRGHHRLNAKADAGHPGGAIGAEQLGRRRVGVAFDGDFSIGGTRDRRQNSGKFISWQTRGGPSAEENRRCLWKLTPVPLAAEVGDRCVGMGTHEVITVGPSGERAVIASMCAKRYVNVHSETDALSESGVGETLRLERCAQWVNSVDEFEAEIRDAVFDRLDISFEQHSEGIEVFTAHRELRTTEPETLRLDHADIATEQRSFGGGEFIEFAKVDRDATNLATTVN